MPVARKGAAKKSAAKPLSKKVAAKKTTKKSASAKPSDDEMIVNAFVEAITSGAMDGFLTLIDDALEERSNAVNESRTRKTTTTKKVSTPPKKTAAKKVVLEKDKTYKVTPKAKDIGGAKVKFVNLRSNDDTKAVVVMMVDKPGNPKGKKIVIPASALVAAK